jgi:putative spermidine/putrescine transport system ATP-binding protein
VPTADAAAGTDDTTPAGRPAAVRLQAVTKRFGSVVAADAVDLEVQAGEFFSMLGPSGSGKTTLLRLIAGFEHPTSGRVLLHGDDVTDWPPFDRDVNTVFQDYALFPHMNVAQNVEYGLKVKKVARAERATRVADALEIVRLAGYESRRPSQLSGGRRQRVALARALVNRPSVLLLDEPLGALDRKLREEMQVELKRIQSDVGITFVLVTHDQDEALTMSDRIAVFNDGRIDQVGTPMEIYEHPTTAFVAAFVGTSNLLTGDAAAHLLGDPSPISVRPEKIRLLDDAGAPPADGEVTSGGAIRDVLYLGSETRYRVALDGGGELAVDVQNTTSAAPDGRAPGDRVRLAFERAHALAVATTPDPVEPTADTESSDSSSAHATDKGDDI